MTTKIKNVLHEISPWILMALGIAGAVLGGVFEIPKLMEVCIGGIGMGFMYYLGGRAGAKLNGGTPPTGSTSALVGVISTGLLSTFLGLSACGGPIGQLDTDCAVKAASKCYEEVRKCRMEGEQDDNTGP